MPGYKFLITRSTPNPEPSTINHQPAQIVTMKQLVPLLTLYLLFGALANSALGQAGCVLQPPVYHIDFGGSNPSAVSAEQNFSLSQQYRRQENCPQDGQFSIVSATSNCFNGHWITLNEDHTPGDTGGKMLLVNASYNKGLLMVTTFTGLLPHTTYQLGAWIINVCLAAYNCDPIRPNLRFVVSNTQGKELAKFSTGNLPAAGTTSWLQYTADFTTPPGVSTVLLKIETNVDGGCGNDFAIDDITLRECRIVRPVVKTTSAVKIPAPVVQPKLSASKAPEKKGTTFAKLPVTEPVKTEDLYKPIPGSKPVFVAVPSILLTRANPVVKRIETPPAELLIDLYDNAEIDGDTVTIYHNNQLVVSRAGLSAKAISFRITVDAMHPHHELVMVANNLGSIPPNTSLMIITAGDKRYEIFISSSEQKNAKVVIDLKSP